ncbi:MAG: hypothetical protein Kow0069_39070 [Promethearchaeota archaeon]
METKRAVGRGEDAAGSKESQAAGERAGADGKESGSHLSSKGGEKQAIYSMDVDQLLDVLGNAARRAILKKLARFPREGLHPEALARDLGLTRQGIAKHLKVLLAVDLIEPVEVSSEHKGFTRTNYRIKQDLTLQLDLSKTYFSAYRICEDCDLEAAGSAELNAMEEAEVNERREFLANLQALLEDEEVNTGELERALYALSRQVENVEAELEDLDNKRQRLVHYKHALLQWARAIADRIELQRHEWEILNTIFTNWRQFSLHPRDPIDWIFDEILLTDRMDVDTLDRLRKDLLAFFERLRARFKFL